MNHNQGECQICYKPLYQQIICILVDEKYKRVCGHYFHDKCIQELKKKTDNCPYNKCQIKYKEIKKMPNFMEDAKKWLEFADINGDGLLDKNEVCKILESVTYFDKDMIVELINQLFKQFDSDNNTKISLQEFANNNGLFEFIKANSISDINQQYPSIILNPQNKDKWFDYWDSDQSGQLNSSEIVRAVIKTFNLNHDIETVIQIQDIIHQIFILFDTDNSGYIDKNEFIAPDGLADTLIAQLQLQS